VECRANIGGVEHERDGRTQPESHAPAPVRIARLWWVVSAGTALVLVVLLGLVIAYRENREPFGFEIEFMRGIAAVRGDVWTATALVFNAVGRGILSTVVVPAIVVIGLLLWRRPWAAAYYLVAAIASAAVTRVVKVLVARPRPDQMLVEPDVWGFPSGHSATAALLATALGIIFLRTWVWVVGAVYTVLMMLSRTYLGVHWISDTVGGMLVGAGVAVIVWAPFAYPLYREHRLPHPPIWRRVPAR